MAKGSWLAQRNDCFLWPTGWVFPEVPSKTQLETTRKPFCSTFAFTHFLMPYTFHSALSYWVLWFSIHFYHHKFQVREIWWIEMIWFDYNCQDLGVKHKPSDHLSRPWLRSGCSLKKKKKKILFVYLERGGEKKSNINVWLPLLCIPPGTWPATQACVPAGNPTGNSLVHRPILNALSHSSRARVLIFCFNLLPLITHAL